MSVKPVGIVRLKCTCCNTVYDINTNNKDLYTEGVKKQYKCILCKSSNGKRIVVQNKEQDVKQVVSKPKLRTRATIIAESLLIGGTTEQLVIMVLKELPNDNHKAISSQILGVLKNVEKGIGKWIQYVNVSIDKELKIKER